MPRPVAILTFPYDAGRERVRMGRGPDALLAAGLAERLAEGGRPVAVEEIRAPDGFPLEAGTTFALAARLSERVAAAREVGAFPLVLAGQCASAIGTTAALDEPLVLWLDAHGDFNTPDTSTSGFLDGMVIAVLAGRCWGALARTVPGYRPIDERRIVHVGGRDFDPDEQRLLADSELRRIGVEDLREEGAERIRRELRESGARSAYLHVDLDVLDPAEGRANSYAAPGGLSVDDVLAVTAAGQELPVAAAAITAYDPAEDADGRVASTALRIAEALVGAKGAG